MPAKSNLPSHPVDGLYVYCKKCNKHHELTSQFFYFRGRFQGPPRCKEAFLEASRAKAHLRKDYYKQYRQKNADRIKQKNKRYYESNKEKYLEEARRYREINKDKIKEYHEEYYKDPENKRKKRERTNKNRRKRIETDPVFRMKRNMSRRLNLALGSKKRQSLGGLEQYIGMSLQDFKLYIESQFQEGMSWNTRGHSGWHIDHQIPLSYFGDDLFGNLHIAMNYRNLKPMWGQENIKKADKMEEWQFKLLQEIKDATSKPK